VHAVVVEAVPALSLCALAVAGEIGLAQALVDEVMLAGNSTAQVGYSIPWGYLLF
jgi:hypothetical protein